MRFEYDLPNKDYEDQLYSVLEIIKRTPGAILGDASITKLFHFISGYTYAVMFYKEYRLHFDRDFQVYIEGRYPDDHVHHWNEILLKEYGETAGFDAFYKLLQDFQRFQFQQSGD